MFRFEKLPSKRYMYLILSNRLAKIVVRLGRMVSRKPLVHSLCASRLFIRTAVYVPTWFAPITSNTHLRTGAKTPSNGFGWITIGKHTCIARVYVNVVGNFTENRCINARNRYHVPVTSRNRTGKSIFKHAILGDPLQRDSWRVNSETN